MLDQGEHVTHVKNATGHALWVEDFEVFEFFTGRSKHDRSTGDVLHRKSRTATRIAIKFGQDYAIKANAAHELFSNAHGVLADHRVNDEQDLIGLSRLLYLTKLFHQFGVNCQPSGRVNNDNVM
ncbi:unannotated protein [freshwater metagenome]|uniref:Unannotated protein n=1 Tax=freshwater metagenome TaxID=449393 RepID=A0A6J7SLV3_9ZZZZ